VRVQRRQGRRRCGALRRPWPGQLVLIHSLKKEHTHISLGIITVASC
jgi:hypothetical protein